MVQPHIHTRWSAWWPFALLCLLAATRWMLTGAFPTSTTTLLSASTGCAVAGLASLLWLRATRSPTPLHFYLRTLLSGALLLSGPLTALILTGHGTNPNGLALSLALVPIVASIAQSAFGDVPAGNFAARFWPALAAIIGLLLLVPQPSFTNPVTDAILILAPLATGIGAALFSTSSHPKNQSTLSAGLSAAALFFAAAWLIHFLLHHTTARLSPLAALLDAVTAFLTLLAFSRIGLTRWSAQFAIAPFAVILQCYVLLHPAFDTYSLAGTALLLLGCICLLLPQPAEKAV